MGRSGIATKKIFFFVPQRHVHCSLAFCSCGLTPWWLIRYLEKKCFFYCIPSLLHPSSPKPPPTKPPVLGLPRFSMHYSAYVFYKKQTKILLPHRTFISLKTCYLVLLHHGTEYIPCHWLKQMPCPLMSKKIWTEVSSPPGAGLFVEKK